MQQAKTIQSQPVVPIEKSIYNQLILEEGYDATTSPSACNQLTSKTLLQPCHQCQLEGDTLSTRRRKETAFFDRLVNDHPSTNSKKKEWYLLDTGWWRKWKEWYTNTRSVPLADQIGREIWGMDEDICGVLPPGPITNHVLLNSEKGSNFPRPNLRPGMHYRGVTKEVWEFFIQHHGGGPEIKKATFNLYG